MSKVIGSLKRGQNFIAALSYNRLRNRSWFVAPMINFEDGLQNRKIDACSIPVKTHQLYGRLDLVKLSSFNHIVLLMIQDESSVSNRLLRSTPSYFSGSQKSWHLCHHSRRHPISHPDIRRVPVPAPASPCRAGYKVASSSGHCMLW